MQDSFKDWFIIIGIIIIIILLIIQVVGIYTAAKKTADAEDKIKGVVDNAQQFGQAMWPTVKKGICDSSYISPKPSFCTAH